MARLYPMLLFALMVLVMPVESAGQNGQLAKLSEVKIVVEKLSRETKELGLKVGDIKNHAFVLLRSKLPRLVVKDSSAPYIYIRINIGKGKSGDSVAGYYGAVIVEVKRIVTISKTGRVAFASLWNDGTILIGPKGGAVSVVREVLDVFLTTVAADWYRDNP